MKQIHIGTCIPGGKAMEMIPSLKDKGFERFEICFHMEFGGVEITQLAPKLTDELSGSGVKLAALGYYCNALQNEEHFKNLKHCIENAHLFGVNIVSTFAGAYEGKSVDEAMPRFKQVFGELTKCAEDHGVSLAIENCPMGGTWHNNTCNIGYSPRAWEMMFNEVPSEALGLEWEPAHAITQLIDPIDELRTWAKKIKHVHGKDTTVDMAGIRKYGIHSGLDFTPNRTPGFGDTNWRDVFFILRQNGYEGDVCIEGYHDPIYTGQWEMTAQMHALQYLKWARGGEFIPNPWEK